MYLNRQQKIAGKIANLLLLYFDEVITSQLLLKSEREQFENVFSNIEHKKRPCEFYGPEYFLRFLWILPDMLCLTDLDDDERNTITSILLPIYTFLADNSSTIFSQEYSISEVNAKEQKLTSTDKFVVFQEEDTSLLTEFTRGTLNQVILTIASYDDIAGKRRSIKVGSPGFQCKWCVGSNSTLSNKFFSVNAESMAAIPRYVNNKNDHIHIKGNDI